MRPDLRFDWEFAPSATEVMALRGHSPFAMPAGLLAARPFLVVDPEVARLWEGDLVGITSECSGVFTPAGGETSKDPGTLVRLWQSMSAAGVRRDTPVLVIGGGVVCDIGAMAASTWHRGAPLFLVPSTLLAMVDACLGGKTGLNIEGVKNQVGTFHPAMGIFISPALLTTLPDRERRNGAAEMLKTALIGDRSIAGLIPSVLEEDIDGGAVVQAVMRCLTVKGSIVERDLTEQGERMLLNLGHTVGHVLESAGGFQLGHGEAVGLGLLVEARMAATLGGNTGLASELEAIMTEAGLPVSIDGVTPERVLGLLGTDKKSRACGRTWALPFDWEDCRLVRLGSSREEELLPAALYPPE